MRDRVRRMVIGARAASPRTAVLAFGMSAIGILAFASIGYSPAPAHAPEPFAIPAPMRPSVTWETERASFAERIHQGFGVSAPVALEFSGWILEGAQRQDLPPELLASLVFAESTFRTAAQSSMGAIGPAQVRSRYWQSFCGGDLADPEQNIYCGAQILGRFHERCGDVSGVPGYGHFSASVRDHFCALKSYNVGPSKRGSALWRNAGMRYLDKIEAGMSQLQDVQL